MTMNDALMIGILGTASIADSVVAGAARSGRVRITAVAGRNPERTTKWAAQRGIPHAFESCDALLESGAIDAVYIPLPNSLHFEWARRAVQVGLPVLVEKPACTSRADAETLRAEAIKAGLPVMEAFMYIHHPLWAEVEGIIASGRIGEVRTIEGRFTWFCDDPESGPALAGLKGGALFDVGCYCVHMARRIAGCEPARVVAFDRRGFRWPEHAAAGFGARNAVDDAMIGLMDFPNGVLAHFETALSTHERHGAAICGSRGAIVIDRPWLQDNVPCTITVIDDEGRTPVRIQAADSYQLELEAFATLVASTKRERGLSTAAQAALDDMVNNAAVLEALQKSTREAKPVNP